ncbi:uncharacterized protein C1orf131 homolog isoform X3 [Acropora millepora]|uniref:uncharacterized protein C1orf131 homolog isoform X3 n=1 Tax=Acropora millepora TaxID=45264 RepID=UPI001CF32780|nr:uncharacterized protein C1orf131 homolog isoform X3 [Acropora millepora]
MSCCVTFFLIILIVSTTTTPLCFRNNKNLSCPAPKVIEFIEPGKEKAQVKVRRIQLRKKSPRKIPEDFDFRAIAREVTEFGMTGFSRSERKKYEDQKALALGGKAPKGQKMPYPMLMQRIKRRKEQEREQREGENANNFVAKKSRRRKAAPPRTFKGRWVDNSAKRFDASIGKFKAGVQCLSKDDLGRIKGKKQ